MSAFLNQIVLYMRTKRYSIKTEKAYINWIKSYIRFHNYQHPSKWERNMLKLFLSI
uniref:phage integrase N-terminal SAM-like domain-containing protein n=1 Tax=Ningiella ruwaisensis TaxID=2364274 RepID=UPI0019D56DC4